MRGKCFTRRKGAIETQACADGGGAHIRAFFDGEEVGSLSLDADRCALVVGMIHVDDEAKRKGIGTALYEAAVDLGCKTKLAIRSDNTRSPFAEAFWMKQQRKARAMCLTGSAQGVVYYPPEYDRLTPEQKAALPRPSGNRWPCRQWEISAPCATKSLEGVKKRAAGGSTRTRRPRCTTPSRRP